MSYEFMHRAHRASTEGRKMGGSVKVWGTPVLYRGGWPVDCASCLYALIPLSALAPKLQDWVLGIGIDFRVCLCYLLFLLRPNSVLSSV